MLTVTLPTFHPGQVKVWNGRGRFNVVRCGRRWGKTKMMVTLSGDSVLKGRNAGIFTPESAQWKEPYDDLREVLEPVTRSADANKGKIRLSTRGPSGTGGKLDFWHCIDNMLAGRGREYHRVSMDEAAFAKKRQMADIWRKAIRPTLLTTRGDAWIFSTPNGDDPDDFFWQACNDPKMGFTPHHAPTSSSPYCPPDELEEIRRMEHPLVFRQEYEAEFVSWGEEAFFKPEYILGADGLPVAWPTKCQGVFAVLDCAVKSGSQNDGTGVIYFAAGYPGSREEKLVMLDYELHSIDAAMLESLAPKILARCEFLAAACGARNGSGGLFVEDAAGGSVLIQQARSKGWPVRAIPSKLMMKGKDERAMLAGGPAFRNECKISRHAFDKVIEWKGRSMNHLLRQITSFRMADPDSYKRADDLLDCFTYGVVLVLADASAIA
jgi:hypothetical protein